MFVHSGYALHAMKGPNLPILISIGDPQRSQISSVFTPSLRFCISLPARARSFLNFL